MDETLKWSYIPMVWVTVDENWWQFMGLRLYVLLGDPKDM